MTPDTKKAVQGSFFDLMVAMDPMVGDIIEVGMGIAFQALLQHHQGDARAAADGLKSCMEQMLAQIPQIQRAPLATVQGGKLDS